MKEIFMKTAFLQNLVWKRSLPAAPVLPAHEGVDCAYFHNYQPAFSELGYPLLPFFDKRCLLGNCNFASFFLPVLPQVLVMGWNNVSCPDNKKC